MTKKIIQTLCVFLCNLYVFTEAQASIVGRPPITEISVPFEPYSTVFDMAQDHNNVLYLSYDKGIKIFDGNRWQTLLIPDTYLTRILYFDDKDRVYVGGFDFFGYVKRNPYGVYEYIDLTPANNPIEFASIWDISSCQDQIYFKALNHVFEYHPSTGNINSWSFEGKLGGITCINNQLIMQDRSTGMKTLSNGQWIDSAINLIDNSLIYELEVLENQQIFIHSLTDNWRLIDDSAIKPIKFNSELPELGSYVSSLTMGNNQVVMGGKSGTLSFLNFNEFTAESFQISSDWIASIIPANDGGLLILSNFKIYHLSWPSPWRIQDRDSGLSSDIFDLATWNGQLFATSRAGVFLENPNQSNGFTALNWTSQEAWNLLPLNEEELLFADSHHAYLINEQHEKQQLTDIIYPRVFQRSEHNPNHIYMLTELDTRMLIKDDEGWMDWVIAEGKPNSVIELAKDSLLITTVEGRFFKVILNDQLNAVEATVEMHNQAGIAADEIIELSLFTGPNNSTIGAGAEHYYQFKDNQLIQTDLFGLADLLPPEDLSLLGTTQEGQLWATSSTHAFLLNENQQWQSIDASALIQGGIYDVEFLADQLKISANSMVLSYLYDQPDRSSEVAGQMMITAATLTPKGGAENIDFPIDAKQAFSMGAEAGSLTFLYSFTDIKNLNVTNYQYRLLGHNDQWSPYSHNTQASFMELPAGNYTFEVRAKDINGNIHLSPQLAFDVKPHWYLTNQAKLLWVLLGSLTLMLLQKVFLRWRERKHIEQKAALKVIINEKTNALKLANQALQDLAHKDSLTGLSNRLYLDKYINELIRDRVDTLSVIMMDMDHFKRYNDTYGHLAGDQLLEKFAQSLITRIKRKQDLAARYGGEEFLIIMPKADESYTLKAAENIRSHTEQQTEKTTVSIGVAFATSDRIIKTAKDVFALIDEADKALYEAKTTGRNQVVVYSEALATSE